MTAAEVVAELRKVSSEKEREGYLRFGIVTDKAMGVPMNVMQKLAKRIGRDHALAMELWETGWYEARTVAVYLTDPEKLTAAEMEKWCKSFDNWGIVDTACFKLFDQSPHAYKKVAQWAGRKKEFEKRAAFALLACLALHDKEAEDKLRECLPLIEKAATDERNFVKKGVSWALRALVRKKSKLGDEARAMMKRMAESQDAAVRWVGKDAGRS